MHSGFACVRNMKNSFDTLKKLYIEPSSACNLKCKMCFRNNWFDEKIGLMTAEIWNNVSDSVTRFDKTELKTVMFAGMGEPLTNPKIFDMISDVKNLGRSAELLTNGSLLDKAFIDRLLDCGLDMLWVSADGFEREMYENIQKGSRFDSMIKNLEYFSNKKENAKLGITFVMMKENLCELDKINDFADKIGADMINLSYAVPSSKLLKTDSVYDSGYPVGKMKRLGKGQERELNRCPFIGDGVCFVRSDGEISPCMQLLHNSYTYLFEEKRKVYRHSFGNVKDRSLYDIWNDAEYRNFRERVDNFEFPDCTVCDGCDDRLENVKDCMYNTRPTCGACLWAQGIARCP